MEKNTENSAPITTASAGASIEPQKLPKEDNKDTAPTTTALVDANNEPQKLPKEKIKNSAPITTALVDTNTEPQKLPKEDNKLLNETEVVEVEDEDKKSSFKSFANFLYNPQRKTVLGRGSLNWAKLASFYAVFYFFLGCFFLVLVYVFASILDRTQPRYFNTQSTMAVRSVSAVVGLGFRPQPTVDESRIEITSNPEIRDRYVKSLRLFRDIFLIQRPEAKTEKCSVEDPSGSLPTDVACTFDWYHIVTNQNHPCSEGNLFGFKNEQPCVLLKLNKVYGWTPTKDSLSPEIREFRANYHNESVSESDVYITCAGTNIADKDVLTGVTYYSVGYPAGTSKFGVIPNYFFPYLNAKDHVQPFVLVQFNKLPQTRLISVTCRAWAPGIEHDTRRMRGMVSFQLYRTAFGNKIEENDGRSSDLHDY